MGTFCFPAGGTTSQRRSFSHFTADGIYRPPSSVHCGERFQASSPALIRPTVCASGLMAFHVSQASSRLIFAG